MSVVVSKIFNKRILNTLLNNVPTGHLRHVFHKWYK